MAKHKIITTDAEIERAIQQAQSLHNEPRVLKVEYRPGPGLDLLILKLSDGRRQLIPREDLQGLQSATKEQIARVEILGNGTALHWPDLDLDHYVPSLLRRVYGTKSWMAEIGRSGGSAISVAKKRAARVNGLKGGRPRQKAMDFVERAEADEGIRKGLATIEAGKSKPARKAISAIMERRALSR
jgi:hypothetical protein